MTSESTTPNPEKPLPQAQHSKVSNDDLYRRSTQYRLWSFTESKLNDLRILAHKKGIKGTQDRLASLDPSLPEVSYIKQVGEEYPYVTQTEELQIVTYYARKCKELANFFQLPAQARSTAIVYVFKFYLIHSVMEYHPQHIMLTCLFLAAKVENNFIGINNFAKPIPKATPEGILKYEYLIMETMQFSLLCHHAYQPLYGFFLDIQVLLPKLDFGRLGKNYDTARELIGEGLFADVMFLFTPPQVALACMWIGDEVLVERYLAKKFGLKRVKKESVVGGVALIAEEKEKERVRIEKEKTVSVELEVVEEEEEDDGDGDDGEVVLETNTAGNGDTEDKAAVTDVEEEEEKIKSLTPAEHYEKIMEIVKKCAELIKKKGFDPTVEESKSISQKVQFCLEPLKYGKRLMKKEKNVSNMVATANPGSTVVTVEETSATKRQLSTESDSPDETKRVKLE